MSLLHVKNISLSRDGTTLLRAISLEVEKGERVVILGPNGAGKSSLLKSLCGLLVPDRGDILIEGRSLKTMPSLTRGRMIAYLDQIPIIEWALPVRDVVALGHYAHSPQNGGHNHQRINDFLDLCDLTTLAERAVTSLSGGERARVLLARALAVEAPLLLVDEPVAALDPFFQIQILEILRRSTGDGQAVVMVSHDLNLAMRYFDRVVLMDRGEIIADGLPNQVLSTENLSRVFKIKPLQGQHEGEHWILPWSINEPSE